MDVELDRKIILRRVKSIGPRIHWEPEPWRTLKRYILGLSNDPPWSRVAECAKNARLLVPQRKIPLTRRDHMALKSMYVLLHEGYFITTPDNRVCCFLRRKTDRRITSGASVVLSTPFTCDRSHEGFHSKLAKVVPDGLAVTNIQPYAACFREMTYEAGQFGPAYAWILHRVVCDASTARVRTPLHDQDTFVGAKPFDSLLAGACKSSGVHLSLDGAVDSAILKSLLSALAPEHGIGFRLLDPQDYGRLSRITKPLVNERVARLAGIVALAPPLFFAWKLADEAGTAEWITEKLSLAIHAIHSATL